MAQTAGFINLASGSPRRRFLLEAAGFEVCVKIPHVKETFLDSNPEQCTLSLAKLKRHYWGENEDLMLAADTIVVLDNSYLGKPIDNNDAIHMLKKLAGRCHNVVTGYIITYGNQERCRAISTRVWFRDITDYEIQRYVKQEVVMDKAGAYAIQAGAGAFIDRIEGSYTNIIGLPLKEVINDIQELMSP